MSNEVKTYAELQAEIFSAGLWNKDKYSEQDISDIVSNFNALKDVVKPPAKIGHSEDQELLKKEGLPAAGWVDSLKKVGNKIVATFKDVPQVVKDLIDKKAYKRVSAEIYPKYKNPTDGKVYSNVLRAVAFLGSDVPAVETLSDIAALYAQKSDADGTEYKVYSFDIVESKNTKKGGISVMKYRATIEGMGKEMLVKKLSDALGDGVKVNVVDDAVITDEEQKKKDELAAQAAKDEEIKEKKIEELTQQYKAVTKLQEDKDTEIASLKAQLAEMQKMMDEMKGKMGAVEGEKTDMMNQLATFKKTAKSESIKSFVKQAMAEGKVLPKDEAIVVALMEQLDDKSVVKFTKDDKETSEPLVEVIKKFISGLPKAVEFKELSPHVEHVITDNKKVSIGGVEYDVLDADLFAKAEKFAQDNKTAFDVALTEVSKETK